MEDKKRLIEDLKAAWRMEVSGARTYRALARREPNVDRRAILERMAEAEEKHAAKWETRLNELGVEPGEYKESARERARRWAWVESGTDNAVRQLENAEAEADVLYERLLSESTDAREQASIRETQREERAHSRALEDMEPAPSTPQRKLDQMLGAEKWHVRSGNWIGQAIYGINDGLGAAFGVVSGVAGATGVNGEFVLLSGLATAIASALSMGSGAYLATKSEREVYQAEISREQREIEMDPEEEREEMMLFYQLKGFQEQEARQMAARLAEKPDQLLKTLAHEELGLSEQTFPNPLKAAISATLSTALGAIIPVTPFFFLSGAPALIVAFIVSTIAHFAVGASKVIVTGRSWVRSGTEMTVVGLGEAIVTYAIGLLIAPALR